MVEVWQLPSEEILHRSIGSEWISRAETIGTSRGSREIHGLQIGEGPLHPIRLR